MGAHLKAQKHHIMSSNIDTQIQALHQCRLKLQQLNAIEPFDVEKYREDLCKELNIKSLSELKKASERLHELDKLCSSVRDLPNKMEYSQVVKELAVVKNKITELNTSINKTIRDDQVVVDNRKRLKIELEKLDAVLHVAQVELSDTGECPSLKQETQGFVPLDRARDESLAKLKRTSLSLEDVRCKLQTEKLEHTSLVFDLKTEIKSTRSKLKAMEDGTYAPAVEFTSKLLERRAAQTKELEDKRRQIENEIKETQNRVATNARIHNANMQALQKEVNDLQSKLSITTNTNAAAMNELESTLAKLNEEQTAGFAVLQHLEKRLTEEKEAERLLQNEQAKRDQEWEEKKALEERQYYAALWIQLRWKAYLTRKALKDSKKKKGKKVSKKGKKSKK